MIDKINNRNILMLLQSQFPPDIRLEKEITSLSNQGFNIVLFCIQYNKNASPDFPGCKIIRLKAPTNNLFLNKVLNFPIIINPRYLIKLLSIVVKSKFDIIHSHDLPMAIVGMFIKFFSGKKLVFDMHENYPEALKAYNKKNIVERFIKNYLFAKLFEKLALKYCDSIITVTYENKQRLINEGYNQTKIYEVSNTVDLRSFGKLEVDSYELEGKYKENFLIVYTGRVSANRGLLTAVEAMKYLKNELFLPKLLIVGEGGYRQVLLHSIKKNKLENFIEFIDWPGHEKIHSYMNIADVAIIPQPSNGHADTTIPHKLFEYMSQGKNILVSDAKPLKRVITETKCGEYFKSGDPKDFATKIKEIKFSNINYKENGKKAVVNKYNWENDAKILLSIYNDLGIN